MITQECDQGVNSDVLGWSNNGIAGLFDWRQKREPTPPPPEEVMTQTIIDLNAGTTNWSHRRGGRGVGLERKQSAPFRAIQQATGFSH